MKTMTMNIFAMTAAVVMTAGSLVALAHAADVEASAGVVTMSEITLVETPVVVNENPLPEIMDVAQAEQAVKNTLVTKLRQQGREVANVTVRIPTVDIEG